MPVQVDPEGNELQALLRYSGSLEGKRVLEIGCGDGRLTWRYAGRAAQVDGIDPNQERILKAKENLPQELASKVSFFPLGLEDFAEEDPNRSYDLILLSWSL